VQRQPLQPNLQTHLGGPIVFGYGVRGALVRADVDAREPLHGLHHIASIDVTGMRRSPGKPPITYGYRNSIAW
jgi:hypothetical protein